MMELLIFACVSVFFFTYGYRKGRKARKKRHRLPATIHKQADSKLKGIDV